MLAYVPLLLGVARQDVIIWISSIISVGMLEIFFSGVLQGGPEGDYMDRDILG